ncbi:hypothetical protein IFM89_025702 [Coptis chinensis]|uniref:Reverse transcriptase zinc-binding domain-containing protein n=1 Tax=Coptis chinensis TaxID=261450 RepID=A0A835IXS1_9MAGN|nr:hypothetical protein IFM89_025702 [Coptis chinensis]
MIFPYKIAWEADVPMNVKFFIWSFLWDRILTTDKLIERGVTLKIQGTVPPNSFCALCNAMDESLPHLFFSRPISIIIWKSLLGDYVETVNLVLTSPSANKGLLMNWLNINIFSVLGCGLEVRWDLRWVSLFFEACEHHSSSSGRGGGICKQWIQLTLPMKAMREHRTKDRTNLKQMGSTGDPLVKVDVMTIKLLQAFRVKQTTQSTTLPPLVAPPRPSSQPHAPMGTESRPPSPARTASRIPSPAKQVPSRPQATPISESEPPSPNRTARAASHPSTPSQTALSQPQVPTEAQPQPPPQTPTYPQSRVSSQPSSPSRTTFSQPNIPAKNSSLPPSPSLVTPKSQVASQTPPPSRTSQPQITTQTSS